MSKKKSMKSLKYILIFISSSIFSQNWTLQQSLDYALKNHPLIKQSILEVQKSDRNIAIAKGNLLPSVNAGINHNYSFGSTIDPSTNSRKTLNTQYDQFRIIAPVELFNWKNYTEISLSKLNKESSEYRLKSAQNDISLNVIQQFFQYQYDKAWLEVLQTQISGIEEQIKRTEKEVEIGNRPKSDIYDINANLGTIKEQWISAQNQKELSKNNLQNAISLLDDKIDFILSEENPENILFNNEDFVQKLLDKNPLYQNAIKLNEIAKKSIELAKSDYYPRLSGMYQWSTFFSKELGKEAAFQFSEQFKQNKNNYVSFGLDVPIFNRFQTKNRVELAKLSEENTSLEKDKIVLELTKNLKTIEIQYRNAQEKYNALEENFENQKLSFQKSEEKYKEGMMDAYTFFMVRNSWLQANYNLIKSRYDLMLQSELVKVYLKD